MTGFGNAWAGVVVRADKRRHLAAVDREDRPLSIEEPIDPTSTVAFRRINLELDMF